MPAPGTQSPTIVAGFLLGLRNDIKVKIESVMEVSRHATELDRFQCAFLKLEESRNVLGDFL